MSPLKKYPRPALSFCSCLKYKLFYGLLGFMNWLFIAAAYLGLFCLGLSDNIRGPIYPELIREFNLSQTTAAFIYALSSFMGFIGSFLCTKVLKKISLMNFLIISLLNLALGLVFMGSANSFPALLLGCFFFGLSLGTMNVLVNLLVHVGATSSLKQQVFSGLHSMYGISSLCAPLIVMVVAYFDIYWKNNFYLVAVFTIIIAILLMLLSRFLGIKADPSLIAGMQPSVGMVGQQKAKFIFPFLFSMLLGGYVVVEIMVSSRLALFLREIHHFDLSNSSLWVSYFFICLLAGRLFTTFVRLPGNLVVQMQLSLWSSVLLICIGLFFHPLGLVLSGLTMSVFYPYSMTYLTRYFHEQLNYIISVSLGIQALMIVGMHLGVGILTDFFGLQISLLCGVIFLLVASVCLSIFGRLLKKTHPVAGL